jgi:hypothetical protein
MISLMLTSSGFSSKSWYLYSCFRDCVTYEMDLMFLKVRSAV